MKKIVKGNDFIMRIPVMKIVDGEKQAFPLPACTDIMVRLCSAFRRYELTYTIDAKDDNVLLARVEGDKIPCGSYALEVRGKIFGNDWRSNEYEQLIIVDNNEKADTEFGKTDEGENSVEMDTAVVYLPPSTELSGLITEAQETVKTVTALNEQVTVSEEGRSKSEESRVQAELARVSQEAERVQAEGTRTKTEIGREANELTRKNNEAKRQDNEAARQAAEEKRETDTTSAISAMQTKTDSAIASMDEHKAAFDNAEAVRAGNEEARQANEQARITAETKRESAMAQAVEKANTASDIAISANEPFVWMPFADLEHWNITAMDLTTGTVTLDTEEHGLAVGDSVTIAVNICDYSGPYSSSKPNGRGVSWDTAMGTDRLKNFPVKKFSSIPEMQVTAVNGASITIEALKSDKDYTPTPRDWQLQRLPKTTESRRVEIPDRYKGKAVTITVEGQYTNRKNNWSEYGARTIICKDNDAVIFEGMGDDQCGLPFVKQIWSGRSGHQEFVDIGTTFYNEVITAGADHKISCFVDKPGDWDITLGKYLVMSWRLTHFATRVTVTPYHSLTGGVKSDPKKMEQLSALIEKGKAAFGVGLVDNNEYAVPESDMQITNFNVVKDKQPTAILMDLQCAFPAQDDLYVILGGQNKLVFGQKAGRLVITAGAVYGSDRTDASNIDEFEDLGPVDGEYHRYKLYVDVGDGKIVLDVDGVRVTEMDYVTDKELTNGSTKYGCMGFLGQSIRWDMSKRPPAGTKLKGLQGIVTMDTEGNSNVVFFAPCVGANWLAYFDKTWYPQMNGGNNTSYKRYPALFNGYDNSQMHAPWAGAIHTVGGKSWIGSADDTWARIAP